MSDAFVELGAVTGRIFAVGDIHGSDRELIVLLEFLANQELSAQDVLVFIGDYIDRGRDSRAVITLLRGFPTEARTIFLRGNHEQMCLNYLADAEEQPGLYLANGGESFLQSYGCAPGDTAEECKGKIDADHLTFLENLTRYVITEDFIFVHAGLNPLRDARAQLDEDIYWIREDFIEHQHFFKKTIIFGHTPFWDPFFHLPYKIGIDTGAVYGNKLTCVELTTEKVFQVAAGETEVQESTFADFGGVWPEFS